MSHDTDDVHVGHKRSGKVCEHQEQAHRYDASLPSRGELEIILIQPDECHESEKLAGRSIPMVRVCDVPRIMLPAQSEICRRNFENFLSQAFFK